MPWLKLITFLVAASSTFAAPLSRTNCPEVSGNFIIQYENLFPESADWNPIECRLYLSSLYSGTLVAFDPYQNTTKTYDLPNVTDRASATYAEYHIDGIDYDPFTGNIFVVAGSASAFDTTNTGNYSAANYTGSNKLLVFDPRSEEVVREISFDAAQQAYQQKTGHLTSGFQDVAEDQAGNSYAIGTFGNSIVKVSTDGQTELWYAPETYDIKYGFGGIFSYGDTLVVSDTISGGLVTFDTTASPRAKNVPLRNLPVDYHPLMADGLFAPSKYGGTIALWSDDFNGTSVYGSKDDWNTATYLGLVLNDNPSANGGFSTATFEIGQTLFVSVEFFQFALPVETKTAFPFFDITAEVDRIVAGSGFALG